jgi:hypothetical protein
MEQLSYAALYGRLLALSANIGPGCKGVQGTNTPAYLASFSMTGTKSFIKLTTDQAYVDLQRECLTLKFTEIGKVMLIWGILKNVNQVRNKLACFQTPLFNVQTRLNFQGSCNII